MMTRVEMVSDSLNIAATQRIPVKIADTRASDGRAASESGVS